MSKKLRISGVLAGVSLAVLGLVLVPGCGSDSNGTPGGAGAGQSGSPGASGAAGASPGAGAGNTPAGAGAPGGGSSGAPGQAGAGGASAGAPAGGGAGGAPGGGAGGAPPAGGSSGCGDKPMESQRKAPAFPATTITNPNGVLFRFMNNCPTTIWIRSPAGANTEGLPGEVVELPSKSTKDFDIGGKGIHGRVEAYRGAAPGSTGNVQAQFTEMNADKGKALNVNLSHVDWVGLPVEIKGNASGKDCGTTACYQPLANLLNGCPAQLLDTKEGKCHAPNWYCGAHAAEPFCQALMASATNTLNSDPDCAAGKGVTFTPNDIFGCAGSFFSGQGVKNGNACCAKVNRNWQQNASKQTPADRCSFYKTDPYNVYAAWAQKQCPYIYAFAYDDVADQSGFFTCDKGTEMDVTYCPGDP